MRASLVALMLALAMPVRSASADPRSAPPTLHEESPLDPIWQNGATRWFAAGLLDFGPLYLRPRLSVGWGRPFHQWVGVETNPLLTGEGIGAYAGVRGSFPHIDARAGARYFSAFSRSFLEPRDAYDRLALEVRSGPAANYLEAEAELSCAVPAGPGSIELVLTGTYVMLVPDGYWVYDDVLRIVAEPPWIWTARTGYELHLTRNGAARVAVIGELAGSPARGNVVLRAGLTGSFRLSDLLELRGALVPAWISDDSLGAMGGQWFEFGLRFRFATGTRAPLFLPAVT